MRIIGIVAAAVLLWWMFWQFVPVAPVAINDLSQQSAVQAGIKPGSNVPSAAEPSAAGVLPDEVCYTRDMLMADADTELAQQWQSRNLPDPSDLPKQARTFTVAQLEAEAASGDVDAMFKLGVKYMWAGMKPYRDPHLNGNAVTTDQQQHYVEKSHFWFWQAALHGRLQAFFEISLSENARHIYENNITPSPEITPLSAAYQLLMQEINPDLAWAVGVRSEHIVVKADEKAKIAPLLATLRTQWQQLRQELGQPFKLDLVVPDYVKTFEQKLTQLCASEWHQPTP